MVSNTGCYYNKIKTYQTVSESCQVNGMDDEGKRFTTIKFLKLSGPTIKPIERLNIL